MVKVVNLEVLPAGTFLLNIDGEEQQRIATPKRLDPADKPL